MEKYLMHVHSSYLEAHVRDAKQNAKSFASSFTTVQRAETTFYNQCGQNAMTKRMWCEIYVASYLQLVNRLL